jgi:hypothetical protein
MAGGALAGARPVLWYRADWAILTGPGRWWPPVVRETPAEKRYRLADPRSGAVRRCAMQCCMVATSLTAVAGRVSAQTPSAPGAAIGREPQSLRINPENVRLNNYLHDLAAPGAVVGVIGGGLLDQLGPKNDGADGLAREIASRAGQKAVQVSVHHGLAALMHRSTDYQPCECHGVGPRVEHALLETFTDRGADGGRALSVPRIAGAYAGNFARLAWERDRNAGDVALGATLSLGFSALFNIARELTR